MSIDEANEELSLGLPEGEFDTVAGFVLEVLGHIPEENEELEYENLQIRIIEMRDLKIETIRVVRNEIEGSGNGTEVEPTGESNERGR